MKPRVLILSLAVAALGALGADAQVQQGARLAYPIAKTVPTVDDYFGTKIADPYRWMEDLESKDVADWVAAENALTTSYLQGLPMRDMLKRRITELWNYPKVSLPFREGGRLFYRKNSGLDRQSLVYVRESLTSSPRVLIDPNALSPDGSVALMAFAPSPDARLLAYTLAEGGADWQTVHVRDLARGEDFADRVRWMRFSALSWTRDGRGFFYSRFP
mgnify:CR=1 FL=1